MTFLIIGSSLHMFVEALRLTERFEMLNRFSNSDWSKFSNIESSLILKVRSINCLRLDLMLILDLFEIILFRGISDNVKPKTR